MTARVRPVTLPPGPTLEAHGSLEGQGGLVAEILARGRRAAEQIGTGRVWMLSSTASGGGVAEMLPHTCHLLREAGLDARWLVLEPDNDPFFVITKALHHLLHGRAPAGWQGELGEQAANLFATVSQEGAQALSAHVEPEDIVIVHDPQPCALPSFLALEKRPRLVWRCHIGVPFSNAFTRRGWSFLEPWLEPYPALLFSSERYIPASLEHRSGVIHPAIDPFSHKNRALTPYKLLGVLRSAGLIEGPAPPTWARFSARARRWSGGRFIEQPIAELPWAPVILQVSRFDPLKGFDRALAAFTAFVRDGLQRAHHLRAASDRSEDEVRRAILVLAGPDPAGVADDPEAHGVLAELCRQHDALPEDVAARVHIVALPMVNAKENALMVNALQRLATLVLQPSLEEGFGLTVTEAMYKGVAVIASNVGGIAQQIRPGVDGMLVEPSDGVGALESAILEQIVLVKQAEQMARSGRRRVEEHFLSAREALRWLDVLSTLTLSTPPLNPPSGAPAGL